MAKVTWEYDRLANEPEREELAKIQSRVFGFDLERTGPYHELAGHDNLRVLRGPSALAGGLAILPMGQYFGGRSVSSGGIALVGINETDRGMGAGTALMRSVVQDMREMGMALSSLYASTQLLYRGVGYERAGDSFQIEIDLKRVSADRSPLTVRPVGDDDTAAIARLYTQRARHINGHVDRSAFFWTRIRKGRGDHPRGYVAQNEDGEIEAYVFVSLLRDVDDLFSDFNVACTDLVATTRRGADRLLTFLATSGSVGSRLRWWGHTSDVAAFALHEVGAKIRMSDVWMLRILDVEAALTARGYGPAASTTLVLAVHSDEVLGEFNNGRFEMTVEDGSAEITRLGTGSGARSDEVRVHINGLAPLYSGHMSPWQLRSAGLLELDDETMMETLAVVFGGGPAWMVDRF